LIAAHFAVSRYRVASIPPCDAVIWVLKPHLLNRLEIGDDLTYPIDANACAKMLAPAFKTRSETGKVLAVTAVEHDIRMFVQHGAFTIHSEKGRCNGHQRYLIPLLIRRENVRKVATELYSCDLRRGDLFPDLVNLADELTGVP
jgi:hypothetical protein